MKYTDIDFVGLTKILRAHATQILPPGMRELKNVYISRSDNSVTLRPDFMQDILNMPSLSAYLEGSNSPEFLTGIYRVLDIDGYIYFSNMRPFSFENEEDVNLSEIYKEGTITASGNNPIVTGLDTEWLENIWAGCLIREKDDTRWYPISKVASDTYITTSPPMHTLAGAEYEILRTHPMANGAWPIQFEKLGDLLVYNPANPTLPVDRGRISGPFYSNIGKADTFGVWKEFEPDIVVPLGEISVIGSHVGCTQNAWISDHLPWPLLVGGESGLFASGEQWISDYNKTGEAWDAIKAAWNYEAAHDRVIYPEGNGYPVVNDYKLIVTGRGVDVVQVEYEDRSFSYTWARTLYADGWYVEYVDRDDDFQKDRTREEFLTKGPWIPAGPYFNISWAQKLATWKVMDPPVHGFVRNPVTLGYYFYGSDGRICFPGSPPFTDYPYDLDPVEDWFLTTDSTADIWDGCICYGSADRERSISTPQFDVIAREVFVGGADDQGPTIVIGLLDEYASYRVPNHHYGELGDQPLYGVTHMFAQDHGSYGLGTVVAVGGEGTVLYSDDGGYSWDQAFHSLGDFGLYDVASDKLGFCALAGGEDGFCIATLDGEFWQEVDVTSSKIGQIEFDDVRGEFLIAVAGGEDPIRLKRRIRYGTGDQVPLQRVGIISDNLSDRVLSIVWDGAQFIAVGNRIWTSPTGETWTVRSVFPTSGGTFFSVAFDGSGGVVAVGSGGLILHSADDGATWATAEAFSTDNGTIRSVVWNHAAWDDGTEHSRFYCCRDKVLLMSEDGITWVEDAVFAAFEEEPMLMIIHPPPIDLGGGIFYSENTGDDYGNSGMGVICKSGQVYDLWLPVDGTEWVKYEDLVERSPEIDPDLVDRATYERITPASFIPVEDGFFRATDAGKLRQKLVGSGDQTLTHLAGSYVNLPGTRPIEPQEPNVLRAKFKSDGSVPELAGFDPRLSVGWITHNNLLFHELNFAKMLVTPILLWIHGNKLLVSCDNGFTWSKGYDLIIPTRNGVYDAPIADQSVAGHLVNGFTTWEKVGDSQLSPSTYTAMVSDGDNAFMASWYSPEGIVFLNITWDGKKLILGDPDEVPTGPEFIPPVVNVYNNAGEKLVFSFFSGVSS